MAKSGVAGLRGGYPYGETTPGEGLPRFFVVPTRF